jgi:terminase large subunit-like protein
MNILEAMRDPNLFAPWFLRDPATWAAWRAFLASLFALKMTDDQFAIFKECTGRSQPPQQPATEAWLVCGRRAGKSFILALCAVFLACFYEYRKFLAPGERGTVLIIATNSKQARVIVRYIRALLTHIPMLAKLIERETADAFDLSNSVTIEVHPASAKTTRGYAVVAALLDEVAFFPTCC